MRYTERHSILVLVTAGVLGCMWASCAAGEEAGEVPDVDSLVGRLSSEYRFRREHALEMLIEHADMAKASMVAALGSKDYRTRRAAVRFFEATATPEICPELLRVLKESEEIEVASGLAQLLGRLGFSGAVPHIRGLMSDESSKVRAAAVSALAMFEEGESAGDVAALICDEYSEVRIAAAGALTVFGAVDFGEEALAQFGVEKIPEVRRALVECLGELKVKEAVPPLVEAIEDEDSPIFLPAVNALARIGGEGAREALISLLMRSDDMDMLEISSSAVGQVGEGAIPVLKGLLKDREGLEVRWKIINAYGKMGKYVIPHFIGLMAEETYPFFKDRASLKMIEVVEREYGLKLDACDYRLIYDEPFGEWQRKTANWREWWEEYKED